MIPNDEVTEAVAPAKEVAVKKRPGHRRMASGATGPLSSDGKSAARMNAVKHGILSGEVVVRGLRIQERADEFKALRARFWESLAPAGPVEEMLVERIVTAQWRLRRVLLAETGEIALSVDGGRQRRAKREPLPLRMFLNQFHDAAVQMEKSTQGLDYLKAVLKLVREDVEREGELTQAAYDRLLEGFSNQPNSLTRDLLGYRERFQANADGLSPEELKDNHRRAVLQYIEWKLAEYEELSGQNEERDDKEETARQAANILPTAAVLEKIQRYEGALERQLYRALNQLERLQRRREGENVPPPLTMEVSRR
jgi:hypothetical protein